jgi:protein tyrosine/serine phosphatase
VRDRTLLWDGCLNVRDLGGHPTDDGRETRWGRVVRADSVRQLSDDGWASLADYGVRTIVDLRLQSELDADPPAELPVDVVHIPLMPELGTPFWGEIDELTLSIDDPVAERREVYLTFFERRPHEFAEAVRAVAAAPGGAVLVHCQGGKDRTGLVVALLLRLARVPIAEIAHDYAISEERLADDSAAWIAQAETDRDRTLRTRIVAAPAEAMQLVLEELERRHGSVAAYLRRGGTATADLDRVRSRLVD